MTTFDIPAHLCELLFVRRHFGVSIPDELPEALDEDLIPVAAASSPEKLTDRWMALWQRGVAWVPGAGDPPSWVFEQPDHPVPVDALQVWKNAQRVRLHGQVQAVQDRFRSGRDVTFVVLPIHGTWTSRLAPDRWLISAAVLENAERLAALGDRDTPEH